MKKLLCRFGTYRVFAICSLVCLITIAGICVVKTYAFLTPEERAKRRYDQLMTQEVLSVGDLADTWSDTAWNYIEVAIPDAGCWTQTSGPLPFDPAGFPKDFLDKMIGYLEGASEVPVYEILIYQDRLNRDICFLNSDYKPIYVIECPYGEYCADDAYAIERYPDLYESEKYDEKEIQAIIAHLDPARVLLKVTMVPSDRLYDYLLDQAKGGDTEEDDEKDGGGGAAKSGGGSNDLWVAIVGPGQGATNGIEVTVHLPVGFTNMVDVFTFDAEPANTFDGIQSDPWVLSVTNEDTTGTNQILWIDTDTDGISNRFYVAGSSWDEDGDGLASAREIFLHRTDSSLWDTDGDGFSDGDEINTYDTDALDKYSVPPPQMLSVSGSYLVDESTNPVVIKSVNIGAWLQWEQFMLKFDPWVWTNVWGSVITNDMDEATAREMLHANVDHSVLLFATNYSAASGIGLETNFGGIPPVIGNFGDGEWLCFADKNFGAGVSNVAIALAVDADWDGQDIDIYLDSPTTGTFVGTVTAHDTGGWGNLSEQSAKLDIPLSGTQTIYIVGNSDSGDIANLYSFRFYSDANTKELFETFRDNYFTTNDLDRIRELGYNTIRLCFFHTVLEDETEPYTYLDSGWERLDWVLDECRQRNLWVILDLHSTPGGQNYYQASGFREPFRNRMWYSEYYRDRTQKLWEEIADRYHTNTVVAGYDLFNEPVPYTNVSWTAAQAFSNNIMPVLTQLYAAVRSKDANHVIFMESNLMNTNMWASKDYLWWPDPSSKGWTNVIYQFHVYDQVVYDENGNDDWWFSTQKGICDKMVRAFTELREKRNVPIYIGEFAPWTEQNMDYWTRQLNAHDLSWGHWNYRSWGWDDTNKPEQGKTLWGLDYRSKDTTNQIPNLSSDNFAMLSNKFAMYNHANYTDNTHLQDVLEKQASQPELSKGTCEFYLNTFDGPNRQGASAGWPWRKVATVGAANKFWTDANKAQVYAGSTALVMRLQSREEADARFEINDSMGCRFSVDPIYFHITNVVGSSEAEIRLSAVRDAVTASAYEYDTRGVIARLVLDQSAAATNITLYLYEKSGGASTWGNELDSSGSIAFVPGATMELFVDENSAELTYDGTTYCTGTHTNLSLASWPVGAVCVIEAEDLVSGGTVYIEMDDLKAWRPDATADTAFADVFADHPDGIEMRAETDHVSVEDYWAPSRKSGSYATNGAVQLFAKEWVDGGTWLNPRRDYHNDVRFDICDTNVVEIVIQYEEFNTTNFYAKLAFLPEQFPAELHADYGGVIPYLEIKTRTYETNAGNLAFDIYRHNGPESRTWIDFNDSYAFQSDWSVTYQMTTNRCYVYYGTNLLIDTAHGVDVAAGYPAGAFPHVELQNRGPSVNASARIRGLKGQWNPAAQ